MTVTVRRGIGAAQTGRGRRLGSSARRSAGTLALLENGVTNSFAADLLRSELLAPGGLLAPASGTLTFTGYAPAVSTTLNVSVTGVAATGVVGDVTVTLEVRVTGVAATGAVGDVTVSVETIAGPAVQTGGWPDKKKHLAPAWLPAPDYTAAIAERARIKARQREEEAFLLAALL